MTETTPSNQEVLTRTYTQPIAPLTAGMPYLPGIGAPAPATTSANPSYGVGTDGQYRVGGQTLQEAVSAAREEGRSRARAYGITNQNIIDKWGYDAEDIARYHWQTQYRSQEGYNLPALQAGHTVDDGQQVISGGAVSAWQPELNAQAREEQYYGKYPSLGPGAYGGSQLVVQLGAPARSTRQELLNLRGGTFTPLYQRDNAAQQFNLGWQNNPLPTSEPRDVYIDRVGMLDYDTGVSRVANFEDVSGNVYKTQLLTLSNDSGRNSGADWRNIGSDSGVLGGLYGTQAPTAGSLWTVSLTAQERAQRLGSLERQGGFSGFLAKEAGLTGYPIADLTFAYTNAREKIVNEPHLLDLENTFRNAHISNENFINTYVDKLPFNSIGKQSVRGWSDVALVYPSGLLAGAIKTNRETPETLPVAYGLGKVINFGLEGTQYIVTRYAATSVEEGLAVRTSAAGISKGLQLAPYAVGAAYLYDVGKDIVVQPSAGGKAEYLGAAAPATFAFIAGDMSVRGKAQQAILKGYIKLTGATELDAASIASPEVLRFYEEGPDAPRAMKFAEVSPAGNLAMNRAMFEDATFMRPTYNQRVMNYPVGNAVDFPDVPKNPDLVLWSSSRKGMVKNYDVITATQASFASSTTVLRGTSKQGGLYVAPTGQAQLYFLGLGKEPTYSVGMSGYSEPNLVRIRNIKGYSEELIPIFKEEGPGAATKSDEFLRIQSTPKTVYLEKRTFYGETPEVQGVIPEGTPLKQLNLRTGSARFFGFRNYIMVGDEIVPVRSYSALTMERPGSVTTKDVLRINANSESYLSYKSTIDPLRGSIALSMRPSRSTAQSYDVLLPQQSYSSRSDRSSIPTYDYAPSTSRLRYSLSMSSRVASPSYSAAPITRSSTSGSGGSRSSLPGSSITPIGGSSSGNSTSFSMEYLFQDASVLGYSTKRRRAKERKPSRKNERSFGPTPSLLGLDLGVVSGPSRRGYSGLEIRGGPARVMRSFHLAVDPTNFFGGSARSGKVQLW